MWYVCPCWQSDDNNNNSSNINKGRKPQQNRVGLLFCSIWLCTIFCCCCCCCCFILSVLCFIVCFPFGAHSVHDCKLVFLFDYLSHALHTRTTFSFCCATKHLLLLLALPHLFPTSCAVNAKPWELNMSFWLCVEWHYSIIYHICTKLACCWHCLWFRCCKVRFPVLVSVHPWSWLTKAPREYLRLSEVRKVCQVCIV